MNEHKPECNLVLHKGLVCAVMHLDGKCSWMVCNCHKPEPWQDKFLREGDTNSCGDLSIMVKTVSEILDDQNTANAERIRELKIVPASTPHGSPYITGVNETAEDAARIVEVHK